MTARASRRLSQPDSRCVPNRNAVLNKKNAVALLPLPIAQLHQRNALPRVSFAARIRKAGRILTGPLPQLHPWLFSTAAASPVAVLNKKRARRATTACAASPAQGTAASLLRGQNPKGWSVLDRTACAASPRKSSACRRPRPAERKRTLRS
jgi:hypothetical protein